MAFRRTVIFSVSSFSFIFSMFAIERLSWGMKLELKAAQWLYRT